MAMNTGRTLYKYSRGKQKGIYPPLEYYSQNVIIAATNIIQKIYSV